MPKFRCVLWTRGVGGLSVPKLTEEFTAQGVDQAKAAFNIIIGVVIAKSTLIKPVDLEGSKVECEQIDDS